MRFVSALMLMGLICGSAQADPATEATNSIKEAMQQMAQIVANPSSAQAQAFLSKSQGALQSSLQNIDLSAQTAAINQRMAEAMQKLSDSKN